MHRLMIIVLVLLGGCLGLVGSARAKTTVKVLETFPSGDEVTLARNQNFYLRLAYATDKPVSIWARPYFHGKPVNAGSNPSQRYSGSGETFGWFFFMQPGDEFDEIRITAGDGRTRSTPVVATLRVHVIGGTEAVADRGEPAWVTGMKRNAEEAQDKDDKAAMDTPPGAGDVILFSGFMLAMIGVGLLAFAAPAWGIWCWRGGWRIAAAVPAAMMAFVVLRIWIDGTRDSTSHNLWPFEILQSGTLSVVVMLLLLVARRLAGAGR